MARSNAFRAFETDRDFRREVRRDNVRRIFRPANDNRPRFSPSRKPLPAVPFGKRVPLPGQVGKPRLPKMPGMPAFYRGLSRLALPAAAAMTAYDLWEWYMSQGQPEVNPSAFGFQLYCDMGWRPLAAWGQAAACGTGFQVPGGLLDGSVGNDVIPGNLDWLAIGPYVWISPAPPDQIGSYRFDHSQVWQRVSGSQPIPVSALQPGVAPAPMPIPRPWSQPAHWPHPFQPPNAVPLPRPWPRGVPRPRPLPEDSLRGEPSGRLESRVRNSPRRLPLRAPRRHEKEPEKKRVDARHHAALRKGLGKLLSGASEAFDFLEALYDALPDNVKSKDDKTLADKFYRLYQNSDKLDVADAMRELIENNQEDRIWGPFFGEANDNAEDYGMFPGSLKW